MANRLASVEVGVPTFGKRRLVVGVARDASLSARGEGSRADKLLATVSLAYAAPAVVISSPITPARPRSHADDVWNSGSSLCGGRCRPTTRLPRGLNEVC